MANTNHEKQKYTHWERFAARQWAIIESPKTSLLDRSYASSKLLLQAYKSQYASTEEMIEDIRNYKDEIAFHRLNLATNRMIAAMWRRTRIKFVGIDEEELQSNLTLALLMAYSNFDAWVLPRLKNGTLEEVINKFVRTVQWEFHNICKKEQIGCLRKDKMGFPKHVQNEMRRRELTDQISSGDVQVIQPSQVVHIKEFNNYERMMRVLAASHLGKDEAVRTDIFLKKKITKQRNLYLKSKVRRGYTQNIENLEMNRLQTFERHQALRRCFEEFDTGLNRTDKRIFRSLLDSAWAEVWDADTVLLDDASMAHILGISISNISTRRQRLRLKLRRFLNERMEDYNGFSNDDTWHGMVTRALPDDLKQNAM